ncbi:MAG: TetR/AcrR family transcriptional regulator [Oscillospiraceae bacterium]|jgi:AcrR family transcriptional regulator|nr:TetR/AcrR family transcriptional regulator [Oscillospiraceae bacterium]
MQDLNAWNNSTTKEKIWNTSLILFSDKGYSSVSMRDIAKAVGINAASIYNHFASKEDILKSFYDFYNENRNAAAPKLETLLQLCETLDPVEVLLKLNYHYPPEIQESMDRIVIVSSREINSDPQSEAFICSFLEGFDQLVVPLLERLVSLKKIAPLDIRAFSVLNKYFCYSAAVLNNSPFILSLEEWNAGFSMLMSMIKII